MLHLPFSAANRDCAGQTRRDFVKAGLLGLGGLSLPWLLEQKTRASSTGAGYIKDNKSVILIFLAGGASHIETFNPNMDGPEPSRSVTGALQTNVPGIHLGGTFPRLARNVDKLALVRSFRHPVGNHEQAISHVLTGGTDPNGQAQLGHSMGSMYARLRGTNHPESGMPTYALLSAPHSDPQYSRELQRVAVGSRAGSLGPGFAAFNPSGGGTALENMTLNIPTDRLGNRRSLVRRLDELRREVDGAAETGRLGEFEQQATDLLLGGAGAALDLSREPRHVRDRYDTGMYLCGKRTFDPSILGQQMLTARRLIESGAGFVTVQSAGWDMHSDGNNPGIEAGMEMLGRPLDKALSALLEDLDSRGMLDDTLVLVTGDFGRTPSINRNGGRDHWASLCTLAFAGGGLNLGQTIGQSDRQNRAPATTPYNASNLLSTLMHFLFDVGTLRVTRGVPSTIVRTIEENRPIAELFA